jgi:membrane protein YdbS with pleckstrin-like domain
MIVDIEMPAEMQPLHKGQLRVLRVRAALVAFVLFVGITVADFVWRPVPIVPSGVASAFGAMLLLAFALLTPGRRYRSWGYRLDEDELHIQQGLWVRIRTIVPFGRVQHIDVAQGPLERSFGVGTLILHTAGTRNSAVMLPGLEFGEAGRIRELIRAKIRQDLG